MKITLLSGVKGFLQRMGNQEVEARMEKEEKIIVKFASLSVLLDMENERRSQKMTSVILLTGWMVMSVPKTANMGG